MRHATRPFEMHDAYTIQIKRKRKIIRGVNFYIGFNEKIAFSKKAASVDRTS